MAFSQREAEALQEADERLVYHKVKEMQRVNNRNKAVLSQFLHFVLSLDDDTTDGIPILESPAGDAAVMIGEQDCLL